AARAVHAELRRRGSELSSYWSVPDHSVAAPEGAAELLEESTAWHELLGSVRYVVTDTLLPHWFRRCDGQRLVRLLPRPIDGLLTEEEHGRLATPSRIAWAEAAAASFDQVIAVDAT